MIGMEIVAMLEVPGIRMATPRERPTIITRNESANNHRTTFCLCESGSYWLPAAAASPYASPEAATSSALISVRERSAFTPFAYLITKYTETR